MSGRTSKSQPEYAVAATVTVLSGRPAGGRGCHWQLSTALTRTVTQRLGGSLANQPEIMIYTISDSDYYVTSTMMCESQTQSLLRRVRVESR